jgi:hypothetical protein
VAGVDTTPRTHAYAIGYHEAMHHVDFASAPVVSRFFERDFGAPDGALGRSLASVSRYAKSEPAEGFAELFTAAKVYGPDALPARARVAHDAVRAMLADRRNTAAMFRSARLLDEALMPGGGGIVAAQRHQAAMMVAQRRIRDRGEAVYRAAGVPPPPRAAYE